MILWYMFLYNPHMINPELPNLGDPIYVDTSRGNTYVDPVKVDPLNLQKRKMVLDELCFFLSFNITCKNFSHLCMWCGHALNMRWGA